MKEAGTFLNIKIDMPVRLIKLIHLTMKEALNEHGIATITGLLEVDEEKNAIDKLNMDCNVKILLKTETECRTLFSGIPTKVRITQAGHNYELFLEIHSYSILLDIKKNSKSYQDTSNTYNQIFKELVKKYGGEVKDIISKGAGQKAPYIQYEETNWEFLKRMASCLSAKVYPLMDAEKPKIIVGLQKLRTHMEESSMYVLEKNMQEFQTYKENFGSSKESDYKTYEIKSISHYELGDEVNYQNERFVVMKKISFMERGELVNTYMLRSEEGIKQPQLYNEKLSGVSIEGTILAREKDKLKLKLSIDEKQEVEKAFWYPFSTCYAAEGSTGWYAIPEIGQSVQLFLAGPDESQAYITQVKRTDGADNPKTQDPATKYFGTEEGRELKISPTEITLNAVEGETYITLSDAGGVEVKSLKDISIKSSQWVNHDCESFDVTSKDKIILATQNASIVVDNVMHIKG